MVNFFGGRGGNPNRNNRRNPARNPAFRRGAASGNTQPNPRGGAAQPFAGEGPGFNTMNPPFPGGGQGFYNAPPPGAQPGFNAPPGTGRPPARCCDIHGCAFYDRRGRDEFWPTFTHPRWLTCGELYNGAFYRK